MSAPTELKLTHEAARGGSLLRFEGAIDTNFPRARVVELAKGVVVFDLDAVTRITSYGVREWVKTLKEVGCDYLGFARCRPALVTQFNLIANFAGQGELLSFYVPYVCSGCGEYAEHLLELRKHDAEVKAFTPPARVCPKCQEAMELDDLPQTYFAYAAKTRTPSPPPLVDALLSGTASQGVSKVPFAIEKDVLDELTVLRLSGEVDKSANFKRVADGLEGNVVVDLQRLMHCTPEGLERLRGLFGVQGPTLFLARLPPESAVQLAQDPAVLGNAKVVSVLLPYACAACQRSQTCEVSPLLVANERSRLPCPRCRTPLSSLADPSELEAIKRLPAALPPGNVADFLEGRLVEQSSSESSFGRYQLLRQLGAGGMAEVFLARQTAVAGFEKRVVVKRILPHLSTDERFIEMFLDEAKVAARIAHPNVVQIFDVGQINGRYFIAMEFVNGWDLSTLLRTCVRRGEPLPVHLAARICADVCAGLQAAHEYTDDSGRAQPIIHRDVSPHNVIISTEGQAKLADFGIAKAPDSKNRTPADGFKGKMMYMAPEQANPAEGQVLDARADLFPMGLILYEALTLEHTFKRVNDFQTMRAMLEEPVPRLADKLPGVPARAQAIIDRALARERDQRYPSAAALRSDLEALVADTGQRATGTDLAAWVKARLSSQDMVSNAESNTSTWVRLTPNGVTPT